VTAVEGLAEALFCSDLSCTCCDPETILAAIRASLAAHEGVGGCAAGMAAEYGEHPEVAVLRMRWAVAAVRGLGDLCGVTS